MANPFDQFDTPQANPFDQFDEAPQGASTLQKFGNELVGLGEETMALGSQALLTPISGLAGLSAAVMGGTDAGADMVKKIQDMAYQPKSQRGQELTEAASNVLNLPAEYGEKAGGAVGGLFGPTGENVGQFLGNVAGNFATDMIPGGMIASGVKAKLKAPKKEPVTTADKLAALDAPEPKVEQPVAPQVDPAQMDLFAPDEQGRMANPFEAFAGEWRVDENGIPIRADLSMDAQNVQAPLQRNLWGDELEPTRPPEGVGLQGVITDQPQGGVPLTQAIDEMDWAHRRGAINSELKGSVEPSGELEGAILEATPDRVDTTPIWVPKSQRGALLINWGTATTKANSPQVQAAGRSLQQGKNVNAVAKVIPGLEWARPTFDHPDKVLAAAPDSKDISGWEKFTGKTVKPGIRAMRAKTNNPLINFTGEMTARNFSEAEQLDRQYITDKRGGIGTMYQALNDVEITEAWSAIRKGDQKQHQYTPQELAAAGFNPKQIQLIEKYYEMDARQLDEQNDARLSTGQEPIPPRAGHAPGVFMGDYYSLVMDANDKPIGFIGSDTKYQYDSVVKDIKAKYPDAKITAMNRKNLGGSGPRSDILSGQRDLLALLAKNDPRLAEVQAAIDLRNSQSADAYANHALAKKGIFGSEGNKPWKSDADNAREFFKSYFKFWSESILSAKLMKTQADVKSLLNNPELDHMPRAKEYVADYMDGLTGRTTSKWGDAFNTGIDALAETIGVGPSYARETFNQANKRLGQQAMGWFNLPFAGTQFLQIAQTAFPEFSKAIHSVGSAIEAPVAIASSMKDVMALTHESLSGKRKANIDPRTREMYDYAQSRGLLTFSEFEDVHKITQGKVSRKYDTVADFNRQWGERLTRPYVFFTFAKILDESPLPKAEVFDTAYNMTQRAMYDYSQREKPAMFRKMGVMGQMSGSLQTFSFNYLDQMASWTRDAAKGNPIPLMTGAAVALAFAGVGGLPFYGDLDELFKLITNKSIKDVTLPNSGKWAKYADAIQYGLLSDATGINFQTRLGAADVMPNSPAEAITPYAGSIGKMAGAVGQLATDQDMLAVKNAARAFAPSSAKGMVENALMTEVSPAGVSYSTNQYGQTDYPRTSWDRTLRNWNLTSLDEAKAKTNIWEGRTKLKSDKDRQTAIERKIERAVVQVAPIGLTPEATQARVQAYVQGQDFKELIQEYLARGGNPKNIDDLVIKPIVNGTRQTSKQRAEGIPKANDLESIRRYKMFNP